MSRPLIEKVVRQQLQKRRNIEIRERCRVERIVTSETNRGQVSGVQLAEHDTPGETMRADLVIDSSSRAALPSLRFEQQTARSLQKQPSALIWRMPPPFSRYQRMHRATGRACTHSHTPHRASVERLCCRLRGIGGF